MKGLLASFASVTRTIKKLKQTGSVANLKRSGRPPKSSEEAKALIEQQMRKNDETTSVQIQKKLAKHGVKVSSATVRRSRKQQGWTLQRTKYCQMMKGQERKEAAVCTVHHRDRRYIQ